MRLALEHPVRELPLLLSQAGAALAEGGGAVVLTPRMGEPLSGAPQALSASGLRIADVQTREPRLESVILELLRSPTPIAHATNGATAQGTPGASRAAARGSARQDAGRAHALPQGGEALLARARADHPLAA